MRSSEAQMLPSGAAPEHFLWTPELHHYRLRVWVACRSESAFVVPSAVLRHHGLSSVVLKFHPRETSDDGQDASTQPGESLGDP